MKKIKFLPLLLALALLTALLSGCMAITVDTKIEADGSGTLLTRAGYTPEALQSLLEMQGVPGEVDLNLYQTFEIGGVTYYGTVIEQDFASLDELNTFLNTAGEESELGDAINTTMTVTRNADGSSFDVAIADNREAEAEEAAGIAGIDEDMQRQLLDSMVYTISFELPGAVRQLSGPTEGIGIDGGRLTLDFAALNRLGGNVSCSFTTAAPAVEASAQSLQVNGVPQTPEVYNIDGYNFFKLRDLAALLSGTGSQFEVGYDEAARTIAVTTGAAYTAVGGELEQRGDHSGECEISAQTVIVDGRAVRFNAYNIGGYNFFKLRELGDVLGFAVGYDEAAQLVSVTSAS